MSERGNALQRGELRPANPYNPATNKYRVLEALRRGFSSPDEVEDTLDLPTLASIPQLGRDDLRAALQHRGEQGVILRLAADQLLVGLDRPTWR